MDCMVIAGSEMVLGFALAGVAGRAVASPGEARGAWSEAGSSGVRLVLVSATVAAWLVDELAAVSPDVPLVAVVPPFSGEGAPLSSLGTLIRQAVGIPL
jgi:vacuolar-type H+-ATPase subunit F/Vma7